MDALKKIGAGILPSRASTRTWMVLTFALFVGIAVLAVGLYVVFVLRGDTDEALRQTLVDRAQQVAAQVEQVGTSGERDRIVRNINQLTDYRLTVSSPDTTYGEITDAYLDRGALIDRAAVSADPSAPLIEFAEGAEVEDNSSYYVAVYRPESELIIRLGQSEPPLYQVAQDAQMVLIMGMVGALLLAIVGSWVAAYQVVTPLRKIRDTARRVSEGDLEGTIEIDSRAAEFQDVAESINRASDSFREKIDDLERLTRLQTEFIGNISHEVRNPIFSVSGYLEALGSPTLNDDQRKRYAEKGLTNLQRLSNLFDDLIEIARLEYREDLIRPSEFDLDELVDEVVEMLRPKAEKKGLKLEIENPSLQVYADRNRIRQVLDNLIDNAIAYTDEGTVRCRLQKRLDKARIEIVDTGQGIDEDHLDRIFERFYRVDPDRARKSGGSGLGLSIVKQILQAHDEPIHVESTKGRGTRFWFELPHADQARAKNET